MAKVFFIRLIFFMKRHLSRFGLSGLLISNIFIYLILLYFSVVKNHVLLRSSDLPAAQKVLWSPAATAYGDGSQADRQHIKA